MTFNNFLSPAEIIIATFFKFLSKCFIYDCWPYTAKGGDTVYIGMNGKEELVFSKSKKGAKKGQIRKVTFNGKKNSKSNE
ncbi:MAG: hypothetical protein OEY18_13650 [Candidatus Aminicenantes bacterium]|nr:hypothetical protein [Candidatus Aminicenantes bacterium]